MRYRNRSTRSATITYHLVVMRDTSAKRSLSGGAEPVASRQISGVVLAAGESRNEVVEITIPEKFLIGNAVVDDLTYEQP